MTTLANRFIGIQGRIAVTMSILAILVMVAPIFPAESAAAQADNGAAHAAELERI